MQLKNKNILVTGAAGFIGSHVSETLLNQGANVIGIDNFDAFYSRKIKEDNLSCSRQNKQFSFIEMDITRKSDWELLPKNIEIIVHLAAKAGVLPSIKNPSGYFNTNIIGTSLVLAFMQENNIKKIVFGSSSSVYGNNLKIPFSETDNVDFPISPYAQSKRSCELLNYTYHHLFKIDVVNLRFFTVYGPRQRPDLAIHKFLKLILSNKPITIYGDGSSARDYTYIDDTVRGILSAIEHIVSRDNVFQIVNLGNNSPIKLTKLVDTLFEVADKTAQITHVDTKPGDVVITYANIEKAERLFKYSPEINIVDGVKKFHEWYCKR